MENLDTVKKRLLEYLQARQNLVEYWEYPAVMYPRCARVYPHRDRDKERDPGQHGASGHNPVLRL